LANRFVADLIGDFTCRFELETTLDVDHPAGTTNEQTFVVRVRKSGAIVFQASATTAFDRPCELGTYEVEVTARSRLVSPVGTQDTDARRTYRFTMTVASGDTDAEPRSRHSIPHSSCCRTPAISRSVRRAA
jgi:hypothetical protein